MFRLIYFIKRLILMQPKLEVLICHKTEKNACFQVMLAGIRNLLLISQMLFEPL